MSTRLLTGLYRICFLVFLAALAIGWNIFDNGRPAYGQDKHEQKTEANAEAKNNSDWLPQWLREHMEIMESGGGRWITDNSAYRGENEPYDAYGLEWTWGVGKQSLRGRLFVLQNKKEIGDVWEYRLIWHPEQRKAILYQFGSDGTFGIGEMKQIDAKTSELEQTFYNPDGSSWRLRHKSTNVDRNEHRTQSYNFKDGNWQENRSYVWRRAS